MSLFHLILSNLKYYRKAYLAILAGTAISTAVLTGALVVGDSVSYSLGQLTDIRLGKIRFAIQSGDRFFRQKLANDLSKHTKTLVVPVLQLEGIAVNTDKNTQLNRVEVLGVDTQFLKLWDSPTPLPGDDEAILSRNVAEKLNLKPGDEFILKIRKQAKASANAPFVSEKEPLITFRLKVSGLADDRQMGRFSLKSNQSAPFNVFINLAAMSRKVELPGNANVLLIADTKSKDLTIPKLDSLILQSWKPEDAGIEFRNLSGNGNFEIRSGRIFIDDNTAKAIKTSIPEAKPVLTYLVNAISTNGKSTPYSFVTAKDSVLPGQQLSDREIIISDWLASDLSVKQGDSLTLRYFKMGSFRKLVEDSTRFRIKMILPITDPEFDQTLMPDFPGMSDAGNCRDWETGAPVNLDNIRDKDEKYWNDFRGTPKAFISIAAGEQLWDNAFGNATAYRFNADINTLAFYKSSLMAHLNPRENGLAVNNVYAIGQTAAANSTDFGGLFLSLSFFIIAAALMLTALLFSLHAQKRMSETAVLATLGFSKKLIIRILFLETILVVISGSMIGTITGILYNNLLLTGLNTLWQDAVNTSMLQIHLKPSTLFLGFALGVITALLTLLFVLLQNLRKPLSVMVKGIDIHSPAANRSRKKISFALSVLFFAVAVAIIVYSFISSHAGDSVPFLSAGGLILLACISLLNSLLLHASEKSKSMLPGFFTLILRNANLKRRRTITVVALLSIGTFTVIITGANRKTFYGTENTRQSGTGGFLFWAESTVPVLNDLNSAEGKKEYGLSDETSLTNVRYLQMLRLDGNDASCLNLNQALQPAILGVNPAYFDQQHSFSFANREPSVRTQHPWLALNIPLAPGIIPGFIDQTVIQWNLFKKVGDTLFYTDERGQTLGVKIMGGLNNSVFQGNVLVSADLFQKYFPSTSGSKVMLIDGAYAKRKEISDRLSYLFQDYGMVVTPASERLAQFNSVTNTYLTIFMMLSGLGIIIGTIGLGIVLLRNLAERKQEIALYQALGFGQRYIVKLIFTEHLFLLFSGIGIGVIAAFAGILPSFFSLTFQLPTTFLLLILLLIVLNGFAWIYFPIKSSLKKNLVQSLRIE
ncbi:MAG: ABC transporter permease [Bacteroidales bacterium]|nr:ABC transporter permease [Bacteroidales bacterium]